MKCPYCGKCKCINEVDCIERDAVIGGGGHGRFSSMCIYCGMPISIITEVTVLMVGIKAGHSQADCSWPQYAGKEVSDEKR